MTEENKPLTIVPDLIPIPYAVLLLAWVVLLIGLNKIYHQIAPIFWLAGPGLILAKVYFDAERIGRIKDNPPPVTYNFHAPGVWAQLDQTIKTLPGYFKNVQVYVNYQNLNPPKGMPMQMDATITMQHPEVDKAQLPVHKQSAMKSTIAMHALITPKGNQAELHLQFRTDPLLSRTPLDPIIAHIQTYTDALVKQHAK